MNRSERTREHIISKAAPIFNTHGYAGTSMSLLTQAIGMTKGAIYGNFKDKDEIALAAFDHNLAQITQQTVVIIKSRKSASEKLVAYANFYLDRFTQLTQNGGCPILNTAVDSDDVHPPLRERVNQAIEAWLTAVTQIVYKGIKYKQINPNVKPEQFATLFVSLIEGGILLSKSSGNAIHLSRNVDHIIHLVHSELAV